MKLPKIEFFIAICKKLELNYEWLLFCKGNMKNTESNKFEKENEIANKEQYAYAIHLLKFKKSTLQILKRN